MMKNAVIDVLEAIKKEKYDISLTGIKDIIGYSRTTIRTAVRKLETVGYIIFTRKVGRHKLYKNNIQLMGTTRK